MDEHKLLTRSRLFTVRLWVDHCEESEPAWYGKVQDMEDGQTAYFYEWQELLTVLHGMLGRTAALQQTSPPPNK